MNSNRNLKLIIVALLISLAGTLYYYNFCKETETKTAKTIKTPATPIGPIEDNEVCMDFSAVLPSKLTHGLVGDMVNLYRNNQWNSIKGSTTHPMTEDANTIWFDLDSIKKFIYNIEKTVKSNPATKQSKLGLRIYYAAYPKIGDWSLTEYKDLQVFRGNTTTEQYEKMHTLIMLPTIQNANGQIKDINLFDERTFENGIPKYNYKPERETMLSYQPTETVSALTAIPAATNADPDPNSRVAAKNHGTLYPPGNPVDLSY